ncbi:MAG: putative Ig domain-containing protein, partial [Anaerolineales bacterium]
PANADVGDHAITLRVTDADGLSDSQSFTIRVANVNDAPSFTTTGVVTALVDVRYTYEVVTEDPDLIHGDALTVTASTLPGWLELVDHGDGTATLSGTPFNEDVDLGNYRVMLEVRDRAGALDTQTFTIEVKLPGGGAEVDHRLFLPMVVRNY